MQWGYEAAITSVAGLRQVSFPVTFSNVLCVLNCNGSYASSFFTDNANRQFKDMHLTYTAGVNDVQNTGFKQQSVYGFYYIAIGVIS